MEKVILRYNGEALAEHSMNLKLIAESLCGLDDLIREVYEEMGGTEGDLDMRIQGGFQRGSFEFLMTVGQTLDQNIDLLKIIGFGAPIATGSLVTLLNWLNGRKIEKITITEGGNCRILTDDGEVRESPSYMRPLLASPSIRNSLNKIINKPLRSGGIEVFQALSNDGERTTHASISTEQASNFRAQRTPLIESTIEKPFDDDVSITFLTVHKDKDTHWRIDYEGEPLTIKMEDEDFLSAFRRGTAQDIFMNAYRVQIVEKENVITMDKSHSIVKVYDPD